jgi:hypothetical protein
LKKIQIKISKNSQEKIHQETPLIDLQSSSSSEIQIFKRLNYLLRKNIDLEQIDIHLDEFREESYLIFENFHCS